MPTRVAVMGEVFVWDPEVLEWIPESSSADPGIVNATIPVQGPSPSIPNLGLWAIRNLEDAGFKVDRLEVEETPPLDPGLVY